MTTTTTTTTTSMKGRIAMKRGKAWLLGPLSLLLLPLSALGGNAPSGQFSVASGVVTDNKTGLKWEQTPHDGILCPAAAAVCTGKGSGWRMPTVKELLTLVDFAGADGKLDGTAFLGQSGSYWSSVCQYAVGSTGFTNYLDIPTTDKASVRCVR